jgi:hypothetical protein
MAILTNPRNEIDKSLLRKRKMENDALKPPEYRRNELGQFERPGATLGKAQNKKSVEKRSDDRDENGHYQEGHNKPGPGRPPGSQNRITVALKDAILAAGERAGGAEGLTGYLTRLAVENSSAYAGLLAKILPQTLAASDSDGGKVQITFRRIIVHPGGREEIEGVTPKALPAPDAAFQPDATCTRHED